MKVPSVPTPVKSVAHAGSITVGQLTAQSRMLPSFLICGGQRCGTTSMYRALAWHPAVIKAVLHKGVHYFDTSYGRGMRWYRAHFPLQRTAEKVSASLGGVRVQTFESAPYYMYHPLAGARIAADLPDVKLVVLTRDPVERAYSQHAHEVARGYETETDFTKALALEDERTAGQAELLASDPNAYSFSHQHHAYRARGEYITYLRHLEDLFGRDRLHVVDSHRFFSDPKPTYDAVTDFLGLPRLGYPTFEQHNARPRELPIPPEVHQELTTHFEPFDVALGEWLGTTVSWRR